MLRGLKRSAAAVPVCPKRERLFVPASTGATFFFFFCGGRGSLSSISKCFMNSAGWTTRPHLALQPPPPFNMSSPCTPTSSVLWGLLCFTISHLLPHVPIMYISLADSLSHLLPSIQSIPVPTAPALPLTFSPFASLFSSIYVFPPCFLDHKVVTEYKIIVAVMF